MANPINFSAKSLLTLLNWKLAKITESPLTFDISSEEILKRSQMNSPPKIIFPFPCHSQSVERHIPLLARTGDKVCDTERDSMIITMLKSREQNERFESKQKYKFPM